MGKEDLEELQKEVKKTAELRRRLLDLTPANPLWAVPPSQFPSNNDLQTMYDQLEKTNYSIAPATDVAEYLIIKTKLVYAEGSKKELEKQLKTVAVRGTVDERTRKAWLKQTTVEERHELSQPIWDVTLSNAKRAIAQMQGIKPEDIKIDRFFEKQTKVLNAEEMLLSGQ